MNVPKEAQAILARMRRRGYNHHKLVSESDHGKLWHGVEVGGWFKLDGECREWEILVASSTTILKCCRDIEAQWRRDNEH